MYPKSVFDRRMKGSEVERRKDYIQILEDALPNHALVSTIKECLHNGPECRPSAKKVLTVLENMKESAKGCHGAITKTKAMRQVLAAKDFADLEQQLKVK